MLFLFTRVKMYDAHIRFSVMLLLRSLKLFTCSTSVPLMQTRVWIFASSFLKSTVSSLESKKEIHYKSSVLICSVLSILTWSKVRKVRAVTILVKDATSSSEPPVCVMEMSHPASCWEKDRQCKMQHEIHSEEECMGVQSSRWLRVTYQLVGLFRKDPEVPLLLNFIEPHSEEHFEEVQILPSFS